MTEHKPGSGKFECDEKGLVVERFAPYQCSFDIFDADEWGGDFETGKEYAALITNAVNDKAKLVAALNQMIEAVDQDQIEMDSVEIGGHDDIPPHPWHEEWLSNVRALLTVQEPAS